MWRGNILDTTLRLVQILLGSPATNGTALEAYSEPFLTFKMATSRELFSQNTLS